MTNQYKKTQDDQRDLRVIITGHAGRVVRFESIENSADGDVFADVFRDKHANVPGLHAARERGKSRARNGTIQSERQGQIAHGHGARGKGHD